MVGGQVAWGQVDYDICWISYTHTEYFQPNTNPYNLTSGSGELACPIAP